MGRREAACVAGLTAILVAACGARSGLVVDLAGDAAIDAPPARDAGRDSASDAAPPPVGEIHGTWIGPLMLGDNPRRFTFQLQRRAGGAIIGVIMGGTPFRTVTGGSGSGSTVSLDVLLEDPLMTQMIRVAGRVEGDRFVGTSDRGEGPQPIEWTRVMAPLEERRLVLYSPSAPATTPAMFSLVLDESGALVSGGFVSLEGCGPFACGGSVLEASETVDAARGVFALRMVLESGGRIEAGGDVLMEAPIGSRPWRAVGTLSYPDGRVEPLEGVRENRTRTDHVAAMLDSLATVADALESRRHSLLPEAVSPGYLHDGAGRDELLASLRAEMDRYADVRVELGRIRSPVSLDDPLTDPALAEPFGVHFRDRRTGVSAAGAELYRDSDTTERGQDELRYFTMEGGRWLLWGNRRPRGG